MQVLVNRIIRWLSAGVTVSKETARRFLLVLVLVSAASVVLYYDIYRDLLMVSGSLETQQFDGGYPLAMLFFLVLWLVFNREQLLESLGGGDVRAKLPTTIIGCLLVVASVLMAFLPPIASYKNDVLYGITILLLWFQGTALIFFESLGRHLVKYVVLYLVVGSVQYIVSIFFDVPVSVAFMQVLAPYLGAIGYRAPSVVPDLARQYVWVQSPGGPVALWIVSGCTGLPALSVFWLLAGLLYFDLKPRRRLYIASVVIGSIAVFVLNMVRLTVLVQVTLTDYGMFETVHSFIGYVIYTIFYVAYVFYMMNPKFGRPAVSVPTSKP